eukprot:8922037-Alexandrium_andersonii.AAC.1
MPGPRPPPNEAQLHEFCLASSSGASAKFRWSAGSPCWAPSGQRLIDGAWSCEAPGAIVLQSM